MPHVQWVPQRLRGPSNRLRYSYARQELATLQRWPENDHFVGTINRTGYIPASMVDVFDKQKRSWLMSRVKGRDTKPERFVRSLLHRLGYRFTVNGPKNRKLPGKPDIVLPRYHTVIFVHGCFWHGHEGCKEGRIPKSRTEWWRAKIERNRQRDRKNIAELEAMGWRVVVLWTCEFDRVPKREALARILPDLIEPPAEDRDWPLAAEDPPEYGRT